MSQSQNAMLLDQLRTGRTISRLTAMHYGVMNLTARITELRQRGHNIICIMKRDAQGRKYGSFKLSPFKPLHLAAPAFIRQPTKRMRA